MPHRLLQIASFGSVMNAQIARSRLEAEGIESFVSNEVGSTLIGTAVGLQVAEGDAERARELLGFPASEGRERTRRAAPDQQEVPARCMMCRGSELQPVDAPLLFRIVRSLVLMVLPLPAEWFARSGVRCQTCGHEQNIATPPGTPQP